ncbi:MBL fold metallo-hydrolase [Photobacterium minamisatsumaniensis]|uniref:MBL fold metallo-hydrolase n=1 Tax=Photobacterium minamisatsumaniensis TaxID=2910233 RepID=UPI003D0B9E99
MAAHIQAFYHTSTSTISYVVFDQEGGHCIVIDSALDFDFSSGEVSAEFADQLVDFIEANDLTIVWILETHAHADHLSAASYLKKCLGGKIGVGQGIDQVQKYFKTSLDLGDDLFSAGHDGFDHRFADHEVFSFGHLAGKVLSTPGHTSDSVTYLIEGNAFVGDTIFMPDFGSARCDFPGGNAEQLYDSISLLYQLPNETILWMCHDYQPGGRELRYQATVSESKKQNVHIPSTMPKDEFVAFRTQRDAQLNVPKLLYPSVQVNIRAGQLPNDYFKIPSVNSLKR